MHFIIYIYVGASYFSSSLIGFLL